MRKIWITLSVMAGIVVLVVFGGLFVPQTHSATSAATYGVGADELWAAISDVAAGPTWREGVDSVERVEAVAGSAGGETWREHAGGGVTTYRVEQYPDERRMVTTMVGESAFGGSWTYRVEPSQTGATLTITEDGEIYNPFFRVVARFLMGYHATMDGYLQSLGSRFGQPIEPQHVP